MLMQAGMDCVDVCEIYHKMVEMEAILLGTKWRFFAGFIAVM